MNRTFVVAALATLVSGAAMAQSSVTIYGRLNLTLESQDANGVKSKVMNNNSSRIGFKGTEDLGGGLKAGFQLEHGFNPDTGTPAASFWGRQSEVNLSGGFGTLRLGNFTSEAYFATSDYIGMHNHETGTSSDALYAYIGRNTNKVAYRTPEFVKGFTIEAAVSAGEGGGRVRNYDVAANYGAGPLHVGVGYERAGSAKQIAVSALYEFGSLIVGGMVQSDRNAYGVGDRTNVRGSVAYIVGASEFHLNVGKASSYSDVADSGALQTTLGYNHNLSKRTKVYGYWTKLDAERNTAYPLPIPVGRDGNVNDFSSIALGVRHNF